MAKLNSGTRIYGTATVDSTLAVTGATTLSSTLAVGATTITGAATVSTTLGVTGATTLSSTLAVTGAASLSSTLAVTGIASFAAGSAAAPAITRTGDLDTGVWFPAANALGLSTSGTNAVYIDSSQNVGIGTSSPSYKLDVTGTMRSSASGTWNSSYTSTTGGLVYCDNTTGGGAVLNIRKGRDIGTGSVDGVGLDALNTALNTVVPMMLRGTPVYIADGTGTTTFTGGNVGIGTTSPYNNLEVAAATDPVIFINGTTTTQGNRAAIFMGARNANGNHGGVSIEAISVNNQQNDMVFRTGAASINTFGTERMRLDTSGRLMLGTTSALNGGGAKMSIQFAGSQGLFISTESQGNGQVAGFNYNVTTNVGSISITSSATTYTTSSDYRLKNTIAPMTGALAKVALLKPYTYKWNIDNSNGEGFIAHELAEVYPQAVTGEKDAVNEDGSIKPQGVDTSFLVATLTAAIQEQQVLIQDQKVLIQSLITRLTALEAR